MNTFPAENLSWKDDPQAGVTAFFTYRKKGCGPAGEYHVRRRNESEAREAVRAARERYLSMAFKVSPVATRTGA